MKKAPFGISGKRRYAVKPSGLVVDEPYPESDFHRATLQAVWFRRKDRVTAACVGYLWDHLRTVRRWSGRGSPLRRPERGGGVCDGRWDRTRYWGAQEPEAIEAHLALLRGMLDAYPEIPPGFDGWWVYER